jgi:hypothetical protein
MEKRMPKEVPWVELLDSFVKRAIRQNVLKVESPEIIEYIGPRWGRMENLQFLFGELNNFIAGNPRKAKVIFSQQEIQEFGWAYEQFKSFDFDLIKLCYGKLSQHIYMLRYSRLMQKELDTYLVKQDNEALRRLFAVANEACDDSRDDKNSELFEKLEAYSKLIEEAWVHSLLR